ncbi:MAG: hypothetical protein K2X43_01115 [Hyphomonadaceae bacterium]|jgi:hypothetical protein|nr:hypothetical protein [Hyphomonadaceae bacterium]
MVFNQEKGKSMQKFYAQGDVILERVPDAPASGTPIKPDPDKAVVLARGEVTGHRHAFYGGNVAMFRDDALARGVPSELYIGHIKIGGSKPVELKHEEHDTIKLPPGNYRVRRQREFDAGEARVVAD